MKTREEVREETRVEVDEVITRVATCPWCEQDFDPDDAVEIHREPGINSFLVWQDVLGEIVARAPNASPTDLSKLEMEAHKASVTEDPIVPTHQDELLREINLMEYRIRADKIKKFVIDAIEDARLISDGTIKVCPQCADSIMEVDE